jgi:DNA processing protein
MLSAEAKSLIQLNLIPGVGNHTIRRLLAAFGSAEKTLAATSKELAQIDELTPDVCRRLIDGRSHVSLARELELIQTHQCHIVTINDKSYPALLKQIDDPPLLLYIKGQLSLQDTASVAIVGSRNPTNYGKTISQQLSYQLATHGITIVSGFARGIDTCAHRGALEAGGKTIAVLGCGLSIVYPEVNRELIDEIIKYGALISEFPMTMPPKGTNFPRRNRIISGLTLGTLVVEASERSGSLITARHAAEQGREVFAVPGQIFSKMSQGTHYLINQGATLIHTVDDLLDILPQDYAKVPAQKSSPRQPLPQKDKGFQTPTPRSEEKAKPEPSLPSQPETTAKPDPAPPLQLSSDEQAVLSAIDSPTSHIDQIARVTQLPIGKVSSLLVMLELKGLIQQAPGKQFAKK